MSHALVSRNSDIERLVKKGYAFAFDANNYIVVRDIPYLGTKGELRWGAIVSKFVDLGNDRIAQDNHQVFFAGSPPCELDGTPIPNLGDSPASLVLSEASKDVVVERIYSNKPPTGGFADFFEKIESYVRIISGPAIHKHGVSPLTFRLVDGGSSTSPFKFRDTLTSRAEIADLAALFKDDVIAIIGLGGTGGYLLDLIAKTPVREIRAFDHDRFHVHNAFRSPGGLSASELDRPKAEVYKARYDSFRTGLNVEQKFLDASCGTDLTGVTFAFVCVDKGSSRAGIIELLLARQIPFIDVGMGLRRAGQPLTGMLRATYFSAVDGRATLDKGLVELVDSDDDVYRTNIQIGELNALNACLAVTRFKQIRGFYVDEGPSYHLVMQLSNLKVIGE